MPLMCEKTVGEGCRLALWRITESVDEFMSMASLAAFADEVCLRYRADRRRCEVLAVRALLNHLVGEQVALLHNADGCPSLSDGQWVSISHTKGYAAVIVSTTMPVAVDIEFQSERVNKVVGRLLRADEQATTLRERMLVWCAKETMYKLFSSDHLELCQMRVAHIKGNMEGTLVAEHLPKGMAVEMNYALGADFTLVYCCRQF